MTADLEALSTAYDDLAHLAEGLDEDAAWQPTACTGWSVRDLLAHLLSDAQRALVALATPAPGPADRDAITYWAGFDAGGDNSESRQTRALRTMAAAWSLPGLVEIFAATTRAVVVAAGRIPAEALIATQGHVLRADALITTLGVEAAVHHLDLTGALRIPGPGAEPLAVVRRTLDGLLGRPSPTGWDNRSWALVGTGRRPAGTAERDFLGPDAARLPLLH